MRILVKGLLIDHTNKLLLARPAAANTLVLPTATLNTSTLPTDALARAFREGTGLIVMPVRAAHVTFGRRSGVGRHAGPDVLTLYYRCIMRGGILQPAGPFAEAGFFEPDPLPRGLPATEQEQVAQAMRHAGGRPGLAREASGLLAAARGIFGGKSVAAPGGVDWSAQVVVVSPSGVASALPGRTVNDGEAPWEAAAALLRERGGGEQLELSGIYLDGDTLRVTLAFAAAGDVTAVSTQALSPLEAMIVADAAGEQTAVRLLPGA